MAVELLAVQQAACELLAKMISKGAISFLIACETGSGDLYVESVPDLPSTRIGLISLAVKYGEEGDSNRVGD